MAIHIALPTAFETPGPDWSDGYPRQAALVLGLKGSDSYAEAAQSAAAFIDPLLNSTAAGNWDPHHGTWA